MLAFVTILMIWLTNRDPDYAPPTPAAVWGCWSNGPLRVKLTEGLLMSGETRLRLGGLQSGKKPQSTIDVETFVINGARISPTKSGLQTSWIDIQAFGGKVKRLRLIDAGGQISPWLARC